MPASKKWKVMTMRCPVCGSKALGIPLTSLVGSSIDANCEGCGSLYTSNLSGGMDVMRRAVVACLATALGMILFLAISWWRHWIVSVVALVTLNYVWKLLLHRRSICLSGKQSPRSE